MSRHPVTQPDDCASPLQGSTWGWDTIGLTKREYFAAQAFSALCGRSQDSMPKGCTPEHLAKISVTMADLLIAALNEDQP